MIDMLSDWIIFSFYLFGLSFFYGKLTKDVRGLRRHLTAIPLAMIWPVWLIIAFIKVWKDDRDGKV